MLKHPIGYILSLNFKKSIITILFLKLCKFSEFWKQNNILKRFLLLFYTGLLFKIPLFHQKFLFVQNVYAWQIGQIAWSVLTLDP